MKERKTREKEITEEAEAEAEKKSTVKQRKAFRTTIPLAPFGMQHADGKA